MSKLLIGVGGVLTDRQEKIIKDKISKSVPDVEVIVVPFMNGSYMIEDKPSGIVFKADEVKQALVSKSKR